MSAAAHWAALAEAQEEQAAYETSRGRFNGAHLARARIYRQTSEALRLEEETGIAHCTVCVGPHPNHECPRRPR